MSEIKYLDPEQANSIPSIKQQFRFVKKALEDGQTIPDIDQIRANAAKGATAYQKPSGGIPASDLNSTVRTALAKAEGAVSVPGEPGTVGQVLQLDAQGNPAWVTPSAGTTPDSEMSSSSTNAVQNKVITEELDKYAKKDGFYESMGVGTAVNLAGQIERTNDKTYRTSGGEEDIATGTARIEKISGNTIVWNQLCGRCVSSQNGITVNTDNTTKIVTISGTTTTTYFGLSSFILTVLVANHKYILRCNVIKNTDGLTLKINALNGKYIIDTFSNNVDFTKSYSYICHTTTESISLYNGWGMNAFGGTGTVFDDVQIQVMLSDLTLIYGEGNEPTTVEQFEDDYKQWFGKPLTYEPYNEGELIPVKMTGLKTTGFNQWDEEWEVGGIETSNGEPAIDPKKIRSKNFSPCLGGVTYYKKPTMFDATYIFFYDANKVYISYASTSSNGLCVTPANASYFKIRSGNNVNPKSTYNNDICINLHWSGTKDGTYEPYEEHILPFDVTTLQGKLNGEGELVTPFADGLKKAGSVQDEIYYVDNKVYGVKRVGSVDLGSMEWIYGSSLNRFSSLALTEIPKVSNSLLNEVNSYGYIDSITPLGTNEIDKALCVYNNQIYLRNLVYTDAATFKTAMNGVMLYYELETPLIYELEDVELPARFKVNDWGTEEQLHADGVNSAPAILSVLYGVNAVDVLRRLPQSYVTISANGTEDTMHKFLAALGTAMGGTWAITVNENDPTDFGFTFTPNDESDNSSDVTNEGE